MFQARYCFVLLFYCPYVIGAIVFYCSFYSLFLLLSPALFKKADTPKKEDSATESKTTKKEDTVNTYDIKLPFAWACFFGLANYPGLSRSIAERCLFCGGWVLTDVNLHIIENSVTHFCTQGNLYLQKQYGAFNIVSGATFFFMSLFLLFLNTKYNI